VVKCPHRKPLIDQKILKKKYHFFAFQFFQLKKKTKNIIENPLVTRFRELNSLFKKKKKIKKVNPMAKSDDF
jgi:hypothetical protein